MDFQDVLSFSKNNISIKIGTYNSYFNTVIIVLIAGRTQKVNEIKNRYDIR